MELKKESTIISVMIFIGVMGTGLCFVAIVALSMFNLFGYDVREIVEWIGQFFLLFLLLAVLAIDLRRRERKRVFIRQMIWKRK